MILLGIPDLKTETVMSFLKLVKNQLPIEMFENSARLLLGQEWETTGRKILAEFDPESLPLFDRQVLKTQK